MGITLNSVISNGDSDDNNDNIIACILIVLAVYEENGI